MLKKSFWGDNMAGILVCLVIALIAWLLGKVVPVVGSAVFAILIGMILALFWENKGQATTGIKFTSKTILQTAVVLLGFGLNLNVVLQTGKESLPIILTTIATALVVAYLLHKLMRVPGNIATLIGVGSSICGGSAIAATAPVIDADDEEVAQAISIIFFFNVLAAFIFPILGRLVGFDTHSGASFGIFAGTAVNDTSSVTAVAATWDSMWHLGSQTLDKAVTVKLTRTLAIIPITLGLAYLKARRESQRGAGNFSLKRAFPMFIFYFLLASLITTVATDLGVATETFMPLKELSKFMITMAMAAIGLNSNVVKLVKSSGKPLMLGGVCWLAITVVSLGMQQILHL